MRGSDIVRAHLLVTGRVQGVFFRTETRERALNLGLAGWVRNLGSGKVEVVFEGERTTVERAVEWCRHGPPHALVESVDVRCEDPEGDSGFHIRYR